MGSGAVDTNATSQHHTNDGNGDTDNNNGDANNANANADNANNNNNDDNSGQQVPPALAPNMRQQGLFSFSIYYLHACLPPHRPEGI